MSKMGLKNIPKKGPLILVGTHNNQFIDAMFLMATFPRKINFIIAASSLKHKFLKYFMPFLKLIPTERPIDHKKLGSGKVVKIIKNKIIGDENTKFLEEFQEKFNVMIGDSKTPYLITKIENNNTLFIKSSLEYNFENGEKFFIIPKLDQSIVYKKVIEALHEGEVVGIFPEGGSHDQTNLITVKPGAYIFALEYYKKYLKMPFIQVCGLNYFGAHKFRSKCMAFYGKTYKIEEKYFNDYLNPEKKRETISYLTDGLAEEMRKVKIVAPTMSEILDLQCAKNLYIPEDILLNEKENFIILLKISEAYKKGNQEEDIKEYMKNIRNFRKELDYLGIKINEFKTYKPSFINACKLFWFSFFKIIISIPVFIPFLIVFYPLRKIIINYSELKRIEALKKSSVKIKGYDVVSSWKILFSIFFIPMISTLFLIILFFILRIFSNYSKKEISFYILVLSIIFPIYIYLILSIQYKFITYLKRIYNSRLYFIYNKKINNLLNTKKKLISETQQIVKKYGKLYIKDFEKNLIIREEYLNYEIN